MDGPTSSVQTLMSVIVWFCSPEEPRNVTIPIIVAAAVLALILTAAIGVTLYKKKKGEGVKLKGFLFSLFWCFGVVVRH